jgi:hypothetical protein
MKVTIAINALIDKEFTIDDKFKLLTKEPKTKKQNEKYEQYQTELVNTAHLLIEDFVDKYLDDCIIEAIYDEDAVDLIESWH